MVRRGITLQPSNTRSCELGETSWSMLQGEFPWCLDDSEQTEAAGDLIGSFDLVLADAPRTTKSGGARMRTRVDRAFPDTAWISYAELYLREAASLLIFVPLESIGAYVGAVASAGLDYRTTYLWHNRSCSQSEDANIQSVEAILWASKGNPFFKSFPAESKPDSRLISAPATIADERQWLIELLLESFTSPQMAVLEPFMSSSQVLAGCQKLSRYCLSIARKRSHMKQAEQALLNTLKRTA